MNLFWVILALAFIQGATEFFPVSSSGHLVIFQNLFHFSQPPLIFDVIFHLGTLTSVLIYFRKKISTLLSHPFQVKNRDLILRIIIAIIPTGLIGLFFRDYFESLFTSPRSVAVGFGITAAILLISRLYRIKGIHPYLSAFLIGIAQGIAIVPGISRSGMTISTCLILGLGFEEAFEFSFLLSIPAILGAVILELPRITQSDAALAGLGLAFFASALFGFLFLSLLRRIVLRGWFHRFAYYCLAAALLVFLYIKS